MKEEFVARIGEHERILYKVCKIYCRSREDEEDLFQDIVLQLWKSFPSFKGQSKLSTWIYRVSLNTAITQQRKNKNIPARTDIDDIALQIPALPDVADENMNDLFKAIDRLSQVEKAIVMLYMDEHSYREMADIMGMTESNIGFKINRIKQKLKTTVNEMNYGTR